MSTSLNRPELIPLNNTSTSLAFVDDVQDQELLNFLNSSTLKKKILDIIRSLSKEDTVETLEMDPNPLDNIIRNEIFTFLNFRKISKTKIKNAKNAIAEGQDPVFTSEEYIIILNQAKKLELISEQEYLYFIQVPENFRFDRPSKFREILDFQEKLPNSIPTIEELKLAGAVDFIITTVKENPEAVLDENLIKYYTEQHLDNILLTSEFIGYTQASRIYANPQMILAILERNEFQTFIRRVGLYLHFITEEKIKLALTLIPSNYSNIINIFSAEQIRLMVDKELDIKNLILKALTLTDVQLVFKELVEKFVADMEETWTNDKILDLVKSSLHILFKELTLEEIYEKISKNINIPISFAFMNEIEEHLKLTKV